MAVFRLFAGVVSALCMFVCVPALADCVVHGESAADAPRPSIGLVLSGGGARGGVHIGVLKAMRELRVPVDCIAGTSIGAVVGGLYSTGMSTDNLETMLESLDWTAIFRDGIPRELRSFRRKREDDLFLVKMRPGLNGGEIELPIGLVQGQVVDTILERYTLPASGIHDFDDLPIPFRAVATNLADGQAVVLDGGNLARALRASMAIPAVLTPVEIDHELLVDGGLSMNLPISVAQKMGADVIIAVDITAPLLKQITIKNIVYVTTQLANLLTRAGVQHQRELLHQSDILLAPVFPDNTTSMSFDQMEETIHLGYDAVMAHRKEFEKYALSPEQYAAYRAALPESTTGNPPIVHFIDIVNSSRIANSVIRTRLQSIELGKPLRPEAMKKAIDRVYGLGLFENVLYRVTTKNGQTGVVVQTVPQSWGPNYLQLGLEYSSTEDTDALFGLAASYLRTAVDPLGGEFRATLEIGDQPALIFDGYQPLGHKGLFFIEPSLSFKSLRYDVFNVEQLISQGQLHESTLEFAGGREFMTWGEIRAGVRRTVGNTERVVGIPEFLPADHFDRGEFFMRFSADTLDAMAFPRHGALASIEWRASSPGLLGADARYDQILLQGTLAKSWGRHTLLSRFRLDATVGGEAPLNREFELGGFFDLSGLNRGQFRAQRVARVGASYYRRIGDLTFLPAFAGISVEVGKAWSDGNSFGESETKIGASVWAGVDTPVGPVYVGYGRTEGGVDAYYVYLGRAF